MEASPAKPTRTLLALAFGLCVSWPGFAMKASTETLLVYDAVSKEQKEPRNFRSPYWLSSQVSNPQLTLGLDHFKASGSGQFTASELMYLLDRVPAKSLWVIDLRRESHGFINGKAVSWYAYRNLSNEHLNASQILDKETSTLKALSGAMIEIGHIDKKSGGEIKEYSLIQVKPKTIESEQSLVERLNAHYVRLPVLDRHKPSDAVIDDFIAFIQGLPEDHWLHFHCRAGKGRTTTFLVVYDILINGDKLSLDQILERQAYFGSKNLSKMPSKPEDLWKLEFAEVRLKMVKDFYRYRNSPDFKIMSWQAWRAHH